MNSVLGAVRNKPAGLTTDWFYWMNVDLDVSKSRIRLDIGKAQAHELRTFTIGWKAVLCRANTESRVLPSPYSQRTADRFPALFLREQSSKSVVWRLTAINSSR